MATQGGAGSQLTHLAQKHNAIQKTRQALNLTPGPTGNTGKVRPPAPPPRPQTIGETAPQTAAPETTPVDPNAPAPPPRDPAMLAMAQQHLDDVRNRGNAVAPAGPPIQMAPPTVPSPLPDQLLAVGGTEYSPEMQFMRLTGRAPSGRELAVYNSVSQLTQQLGRPPTRNEVLLHVSTPVEMNSGPAPVSG